MTLTRRTAASRIRRETAAIKLKEKRIVWVDPVPVAEVEFRGWTGDGMLRHASYKGLREAADATSVFRRRRSWRPRDATVFETARWRGHIRRSK